MRYMSLDGGQTRGLPPEYKSHLRLEIQIGNILIRAIRTLLCTGICIPLLLVSSILSFIIILQGE